MDRPANAHHIRLTTKVLDYLNEQYTGYTWLDEKGNLIIGIPFAFCGPEVLKEILKIGEIP